MLQKGPFIEILMTHQVLKFGEFTLKSGRLSPYFFNIGAINEGSGLNALGEAYADTITQLKIPVSCVFGPAYKGIPLATATSLAFYNKYQQSIPYCFNRKHTKTYGDGGDLVGASLEGNIIMVDDVITAGTTVNEVANLFTKYSATLSGIVIALDREEKNPEGKHALSAVSEHFHVPISPIITLTDIIEYLKGQAEYAPHLEQIANYQQEYGAKA